jgi:hypothetical protein
VVEPLPSKCRTLSSIPSTGKKKKEERKKRKETGSRREEGRKTKPWKSLGGDSYLGQLC